jgi:regulator of protease activity HflC (stomatin/prohibitin superfamily)
VREGPGLAFFHWAPAAEIAAIPIGTADLPFAFAGTTADFQAVTAQGQITYRVAEPRKLAALLDYTVDAHMNHRSEDPQKLGERLVNEALVITNAVVQRHALKDLLRRAGPLAADVLAGLRASPGVAMLGVEPLSFSVLSLKPSPEMARALEAESREGLQRDADAALYLRRNTAVEQERRIKESELATEVALEERRRGLIEQRTANEKAEADSRAYAMEAVLKPVHGVDWKTLLVLGKGLDPRAMIALAFRDLADNAAKIGTLNISPELLEALTKK